VGSPAEHKIARERIMQINVSFDQPQNTLPAGFVTDVNYVVNLYDSLFV
jgi:hypothetical protein